MCATCARADLVQKHMQTDSRLWLRGCAILDARKNSLPYPPPPRPRPTPTPSRTFVHNQLATFMAGSGDLSPSISPSSSSSSHQEPSTCVVHPVESCATAMHVTTVAFSPIHSIITTCFKFRVLLPAHFYKPLRVACFRQPSWLFKTYAPLTKSAIPTQTGHSSSFAEQNLHSGSTLS
ncbi:unnamed protein product [Periconia digitata]|uniref:Uncharacterized protein n=1 Tax=Periconia digitata TaxID=1303443 RepID=A0A9W4XVZ0_9PLEO|nr:unnamed protein product [Periconia digitata]